MSANTSPAIVISAASEDLDESDPRWRQQVQSLYGDLREQVGDLRQEVRPVDGRKGGVESIILALGSAGAITAAVQVFQAWLARGRRRSLTLEIDRDGKRERVTVTGEGFDRGSVERLMGQALKR